MKFSPSVIFTSLCAFTAALPASSNVQQPNTSAIHTLDARQQYTYNPGVNIFYDDKGHIRLFGLLAITDNGVLEALTTGVSTGVSQLVGDSVFAHMRGSLYLYEGTDAFILSLWQSLFAVKDDVVNGVFQGTVGTQIDASEQLRTWGPSVYQEFTQALHDYFSSENVPVTLTQVVDAFSIGTAPPVGQRRSLIKRQEGGNNAFCTSPPDLRKFFQNSVPGAFDSTSGC